MAKTLSYRIKNSEAIITAVLQGVYMWSGGSLDRSHLASQLV